MCKIPFLSRCLYQWHSWTNIMDVWKHNKTSLFSKSSSILNFTEVYEIIMHFCVIMNCRCSVFFLWRRSGVYIHELCILILCHWYLPRKMRTSYYIAVLIKKILLLDIFLRFTTVIKFYLPSTTKSPIHNQIVHLPAHMQLDFNKLNSNRNYGRGTFSCEFRKSRTKPRLKLSTSQQNFLTDTNQQ